MHENPYAICWGYDVGQKKKFAGYKRNLCGLPTNWVYILHTSDPKMTWEGIASRI
jgi:hypothetical protein